MPLRLASCVWAAAALLSVLPSLVLAGNDSHLIVYPDTTTLPYVIHLPSTYNTSTSTFPAILFLHGNGSLGGIDVLADQTTWDGVGLLMSEYDAGNTTGAQAEVAEGWIVILPLAPTGTIDWNETQVMEVLESVQSEYRIDGSRIALSGYSIGSWGAWNTALYSPTTFSAIIPSAGGDSFTSTQLSTLLTRSSNSTTYSPLSVYAFAGTNDTQQPYTGIQSNLALMQSLPGASGANLSFVGIDGDHHDMTSVPFDEVGLWEWLKEQRRVVVQSPAVGNTTSPSSVVPTSTQGTTTMPTVSSTSTSVSGSAVSNVGSTGAVATATQTSAARRRGGRGILWW